MFWPRLERVLGRGDMICDHLRDLRPDFSQRPSASAVCISVWAVLPGVKRDETD